MGDISCPFPAEHPVLTSLCRLASIIEHGAVKTYEGQHHTLHQLYKAAKEVHGQLLQFADEVGIGSARLFPQYEVDTDDVATLQLHDRKPLYIKNIA